MKLNEKLIEIGEFIHKSLLDGSSKTNPAFDEAMLLFVCNSLTILKEQKAVSPYMDYDGHDVWRCGKCGATIFHIYHDESDEDWKNYAKFCRQCGKEIKWK